MDNSFILRSRYDEINDILYLHFTPSALRCYSDCDMFESIVLRREIDTNAIVGITIFDPKRCQYQREEELRQLGYSFNLKNYLS